jgi:WD40 repeat protein
MKDPEHTKTNRFGWVLRCWCLITTAIVAMWTASGGWAGTDEDAVEIPPCIRVVAVSNDGKTAVTADAESVIRVWDLAQRSLRRTVDVAGLNGNSFPSYAISEDGNYALVGHSDGFQCLAKDMPVLAPRKTLTLWDLTTGKEIRTFANKGECVGSIALSPDGKLALASGVHFAPVTKNSDGGLPVALSTLRLWDVSTGQPLHTLLDRNPYFGGAVTFSAEGKLCAVGGGIGQRVQGTKLGWDVKIWDTMSGMEVGSIPAEKGSAGVTCLAFSPDSSYIVAAVGQRMIHLWNRTSGKLIWSWGDSARVWTAHCVKFSPDGKTITACGPETNFLRRIPKAAEAGRLVMIDAATGKEKMGFTGTEQWLAACAFTPDGKHIVAAAALGTQYVDASNGAVKFLLRK